jgi:hypothetical protein
MTNEYSIKRVLANLIQARNICTIQNTDICTFIEINANQAKLTIQDFNV